MRALINRSTLAVLLAPALAAVFFSAWDLVQRPETGGALTPVYFVYAYAFAFPAAALAMIGLKAWNLTRLWHFAVAGLLAGFVCAVLTAGGWPQAVFAIVTIGVLVGAIVWFISEWHRDRAHPIT